MKRTFWGSGPASSEEAENGTAAPVEAKRPRRGMRVIVTLALSGAVGGYLVSYAFTPVYLSSTEVWVEGQKVPAEYVHSLITTDFTQYVDALQSRVLSANRLQRVILGLDLARPGEEAKLMEDIRSKFEVVPTMTPMSAVAAIEEENSNGKKESSGIEEPVPVFMVRYTDSNPERAQKICNALTSLLLEENLKFRSEVAMDTVGFLGGQLAAAKQELDAQGAKLAEFKKRHMGQLHTDGRTAMDPMVEGEYKALTRDNDTNEAFYRDLLAKKNSAELSSNMETQQLGEQMTVLSSANRPEAPEFPVRPLFALGGLCAGLILGIVRLLWPAARTLFQRLALLFPASTEI